MLLRDKEKLLGNIWRRVLCKCDLRGLEILHIRDKGDRLEEMEVDETLFMKSRLDGVQVGGNDGKNIPLLDLVHASTKKIVSSTSDLVMLYSSDGKINLLQSMVDFSIDKYLDNLS